ncbi:MAG: DUF4442 domain-containing protein [Bacteroidota bacterium]|nr:DUF4442 domain-containing protein [Bacteroidota bacterium]MDP4244543.1 DUF4442 domain-containing protein [Bacteroidota bacterium]MDP4255550.1 DUF4442 domain-containing protein [Bacteroidota bacterium]MDP4259959.1 DUF4442 domain-containing protein [Bacteroidota bacterium]
MKNGSRFRLYLLLRMPSAYFAGLRIREIDASRCSVTVPYSWFSKNPFRSTYFACLGMAAEMSTGLLAMSNVYELDPPVSMLVVSLEASFSKRAVGKTVFTCSDGQLLRKVIEEAVISGESRSFRARSLGTNAAGETVAEFFITWSFKVKAVSARTNK